MASERAKKLHDDLVKVRWKHPFEEQRIKGQMAVIDAAMVAETMKEARNNP